MNRSEIRKYLLRYKELEEQEESEAEQAEKYRDRAIGLSASHLSHSPASTVNRCMDDYVAELVDSLHTAADLERQAAKAKKEILTTIDMLDDSDQKRIIRFKYIDGMTYNEIAGRMNYSYRTVRRKHQQALDKLASVVLW